VGRSKKRVNKTAKQKKPRQRAIFAKTYDFADQNPVHAYLDSFGKDSQRTMRAALESIADILSHGKTAAEDLAWHLLRPQHVSALRGRMLKFYAPATANRYLCALRGVLKEAWRLELIDRDSMERIVDVAPVRGKREPRGRAITAEELQAVFESCADDENAAVGARDAAALALMYGTGIRRSEAASATVENLALKKGSLRVLGKGNKERTVFLPAGTVNAIAAWLTVRGRKQGPLLTRISKSGRVRDHGISDQLIYNIVRKRHLLAGVKPFTPHDLRRSFISELLDDGVDIATVAASPPFA